jgi:DNA-binding transcriptional LysR family regulator
MPAAEAGVAAVTTKQLRHNRLFLHQEERMDLLRSMKIFVRVIDEGGFAKAARALDLAPPVVTRAISDLEAHLGARLLNRTTRRIALTEVGENYLQRARSILIDIDEAEALASASTSEARGQVRVLVPPAFAVHQLAKHLPKFRSRYPQVTVEIAAPGAVEAVDEDFDVTMLIVRQRLDGDFVARRLARTEVIACASPEYLDLRGRPAHPRDLVQHVHPRSPRRQHAENLLPVVEERADPVAVAGQDAREHGDERGRDALLRQLARAEVDASRQVEQEPRMEVAVLDELAHIGLLEPCRDVPVDAAHIVVHLVLAQVGEVDAAAAQQRAVIALQQPVEPPQHRPLEAAQQRFGGARRFSHAAGGGPAACRAPRSSSARAARSHRP